MERNNLIKKGLVVGVICLFLGIALLSVSATDIPVSLICELRDTHFNELVDIIGNKYDFKVASQRLYKYADKITYMKDYEHNICYAVKSGNFSFRKSRD